MNPGSMGGDDTMGANESPPAPEEEKVNANEC